MQLLLKKLLPFCLLGPTAVSFKHTVFTFCIHTFLSKALVLWSSLQNLRWAHFHQSRCNALVRRNPDSLNQRKHQDIVPYVTPLTLSLADFWGLFVFLRHKPPNLTTAHYTFIYLNKPYIIFITRKVTIIVETTLLHMGHKSTVEY